ncbi:hypothetical protein JB92DRAFT_3127332 [Gautieria morchelliformis]|nr:hypothetical protein JB92DRAFT_3127332 [Gautieria morchelliformis]
MRHKMGLNRFSRVSSSSGSGEELDDTLERSMKIAAGAPRTVEARQDKSEGSFLHIELHIPPLHLLCCAPLQTRLVAHQPSSRKPPEPSANLRPSSHFVASKTPMQSLPPSNVVSPPPRSWSPSPTSTTRLRPRQTLDQLIVHQSETRSGLVCGCPESEV